VDEDLCLLFVGEPLCDIVDACVEDAWVDDVARMRWGDCRRWCWPLEVARGLVMAMGVWMLVRHLWDGGQTATATKRGEIICSFPIGRIRTANRKTGIGRVPAMPDSPFTDIVLCSLLRCQANSLDRVRKTGLSTCRMVQEEGAKT